MGEPPGPFSQKTIKKTRKNKEQTKTIKEKTKTKPRKTKEKQKEIDLGLIKNQITKKLLFL